MSYQSPDVPSSRDGYHRRVQSLDLCREMKSIKQACLEANPGLATSNQYRCTVKFRAKAEQLYRVVNGAEPPAGDDWLLEWNQLP